MNARIFFWSLTAALAGFLFGFDTVVISGAEKTIQSLWRLSPGLHGFAIASALYGTVFGALFGGWPADRFGRKFTLLWIGLLYIVGAAGSALAPNVGTLIVARFIGGLGIGVSTVVAPMYIAEIAPPKNRGRLGGMFQFNIVLGIPGGFRLQRSAGGNRPKCLALDARRGGVSILVIRSRLPEPSRKSALAFEQEGRSRSRAAGVANDRARRSRL